MFLTILGDLVLVLDGEIRATLLLVGCVIACHVFLIRVAVGSKKIGICCKVDLILGCLHSVLLLILVDENGRLV